MSSGPHRNQAPHRAPDHFPEARAVQAGAEPWPSEAASTSKLVIGMMKIYVDIISN
jgi:hypothetical protein